MARWRTALESVDDAPRVDQRRLRKRLYARVSWIDFWRIGQFQQQIITFIYI
jgi:hypothetical protein